MLGVTCNGGGHLTFKIQSLWKTQKKIKEFKTKKRGNYQPLHRAVKGRI